MDILSREMAARFYFIWRYRTDRPMLFTATINKNCALLPVVAVPSVTVAKR
jgi:hypothetical protein